MRTRAFTTFLGPDADSDLVADLDGKPLAADQGPQSRAARGEAFAMEFTREQNGQRSYYEVIGRPVGVRGEFEGGVLVIRDITDRSLRRLQDEFIATASHELRTPLTVLRGYLSLLAREGYEHRHPEFVRLAEEQTKRMERLVYDLLDVVRLQSGQLALRESAVDVNEVVNHAVKTVATLFEDRTFTFSPASQPNHVIGDTERIEQVFLNILLNAAEFTPPGQEISVSVRRRRDNVAVAVRDSGPGIEASDVPHLFTRFFRSTHQSPARASGLGLGLYISHEIVQAHGGRIAVKSRYGVGTTFTIFLPSGKENPRVETLK